MNFGRRWLLIGHPSRNQERADGPQPPPQPSPELGTHSHLLPGGTRVLGAVRVIGLAALVARWPRLTPSAAPLLPAGVVARTRAVPSGSPAALPFIAPRLFGLEAALS